MNAPARVYTNKHGAALVLVIGITALLVITVLVFLRATTSHVDAASKTTFLVQTNQLASLATGQVLRELVNEAKAGSISPELATLDRPVLYPATPLSAVPDRSSAAAAAGAVTPTPPNLLKQSASGKPFYSGTLTFNGQPVYPQAGTYPSFPHASGESTASGRGSISAARWNAPLLLPRANPASPANWAPATSGLARIGGDPKAQWQWTAPHWVYLQADGARPVSLDAGMRTGEANPVIGRYAFQMYDIGGLLDANVAGYDPDSAVVGDLVAARRGSTGLADLTQIGLKPAHLKQLLAHRNPATLAESDAGPFGHRYVNFLLNAQNNLGFLRVASTSADTGLRNRAFHGRLEMLRFFQKLAGSDLEKAQIIESLQCLTHFSRGLEQPSYRPGFYDTAAAASTPLRPVFTRPTIVPPAGRVDDTIYPINVVPTTITAAAGKLLTTDVRVVRKLPFEMALGNNRGGNDAWGTVAERGGPSTDMRPLQDVINPGLLEVRVSKGFLRQDGTQALPPEPLVKRRFPLERLAWLTHKGPSAELQASDPLYNARGNAKAIRDCFGLAWTRGASGSYFWAYSHGKTGGIFKLEDLLVEDAATGRPREPDFFELLKAGIGAGSLGKSAVASHREGSPWDVATYQQARDRKTEFQILEIGANLIDQNDADHFPTIIKLPNPDPGLTAETTRYAPPLFTARGVEDLPYFYRFHWRGIEDANDRPNIPLPAPGGMREISGNLGAYAGDKFKCGTTAVIGFPELWNPHADNPGKSFDPRSAPSEFRIAAASETPEDVVDPPKSTGNPSDKGLSTLPKLGGLPTVSPASQVWVDLVNANYQDFTVRPLGFFGYGNNNSTTLTWANAYSLQSNPNPPYYRWYNQTWDWPADNLEPVYFGYIPASGTAAAIDYRMHGLFWNRTPILSNGPLLLDSQQPSYSMSFATMWAIPAETLFDEAFPAQPAPSPTWPEDTALFKGKISVGKMLAEFPTPGDYAKLYKVGEAPAYAYYTWDGAAYVKVNHPFSPDISRVALSSGYTVRDGDLKYSSGASVPNPFPPYQSYLRALSDAPGLQRKLFQGNPLLTSVPGSPAGNPGNAQSNRTIDLRGTELLFSVADNTLFREPTTLCQPGLPAGSKLEAGPDNFFSGKPYLGAVKDAAGQNWVGFSLGEVPSQYILAAKLSQRNKVVQYVNSAFPALGTRWNFNLNDPAQDLTQNRLGEIPLPPPAGDTQLQPFYKARYFQVPVTVAGVGRTQFTIRLQFKDANGVWVTYDERMIDINPEDSGRWSSGPVLGKSEIQPAKQDAYGNVAWKDNSRPLSWSYPFVTSYDPRTPRFGQPMRAGYTNPNSVRGTTARDLQLLNATAANPSALFPSGGNKTDRPGNTVVDLPVANTTAQTVTPRWLVPAAWNKYFIFGASNGPAFDPAYRYAVGKTPADGTGDIVWWANGKDSKGILFQKPSANALDYGWQPRLYKSTVAGATPVPTTYNYNLKTGVSPDPNLAHFLQDGNGVYYADSLRIGDFSENIAPAPSTSADPNAPYRQAYSDPDDVVRRAAGALASIGGYTNVSEGLPMSQGNTAKLANRPVILNRKFRSVAEMGYAFRGTPWKHLDFSLPETADAALLDIFSISEPPPIQSSSGGLSSSDAPIVAGKVNLNTRQECVLKALMAGALKDELTPGDTLAAATDATKAAQALIDRTTGTKPWLGPLTNNAELAGKLFGRDLTGITGADPVYTSTVYRTSTEPARNPDIAPSQSQLNWHFTGFSADLARALASTRDSKTQRLREAALRALADSGQTRVWNVMLDLIVQTGNLAPHATSLGGFNVTGERRVWVYVAMDRFTGEILDRQAEWVSE
jgi:hypothetical protein